MKIAVNKLTIKQLNWAVAKVCGRRVDICLDGIFLWSYIPDRKREEWHPTLSWEQAGPIIEDNGIELRRMMKDNWHARKNNSECAGKTLLIAVMRAVVAYRIGDELELPEELR